MRRLSNLSWPLLLFCRYSSICHFQPVLESLLNHPVEWARWPLLQGCFREAGHGVMMKRLNLTMPACFCLLQGRHKILPRKKKQPFLSMYFHLNFPSQFSLFTELSVLYLNTLNKGKTLRSLYIFHCFSVAV